MPQTLDVLTNTIQIAELDNISQVTNNDSDVENYICYNLVQNILPNDLTGENKPSSLNVYPNDTQSQLIGKTMILNNEALINNELFGMKVTYEDNGGSTRYDSVISTIDANLPNQIINVDITTVSLFDSNLKIDVAYNNDQQLTNTNVNNSGVWRFTCNRSLHSNVNTFCAINSSYNRDGDSPFYIEESSYNTYVLGNDSTKWFNVDTEGLPLGVGDGKLKPNTIDSQYQLGTNSLTASVLNQSDNNYSFSKYKFVQNSPTITASVTGDSVSFSNIPFQYVSGGTAADITSSTFNFTNSFLQTNDVENNFTLTATVSNTGGYTIDSATPNGPFTLDQSSLTRSATEPYMAIPNLSSKTHSVIITNGTTTLDNSHSSSYENIITFNNTEAETLDVNFYNVNGLIDLVVDTSDNRVYYPSTGGSNTSTHGTKSSLTDRVIVTYPSENINNNIGLFENGSMLTTENVSFYVEVQAPSTVYSNPSTFLNVDRRNLAYNNGTIVTISSTAPLPSSSVVPTDISFISSITLGTNEIHMISIKTSSLLVDNSKIKDIGGVDVQNTNATVSVSTSTPSSMSNYSVFEVRLYPKTIQMLSDSLNFTNTSWNLLNRSDYLNGISSKVGVMNDSYLFMTTSPAKPIDISYEFIVTSPGNMDAIKHLVKITFYDIVDNQSNDDTLSYSTTPTVFILDEQDITFTDVSYTDKLIAKTNVDDSNPLRMDILPIDPNNFNVTKYNFEKYVRIKTYKASFDPKCHFYTNVFMQTPLIAERITYYKMFEKSTGNETPYLLKYCYEDNINSINILSNVYVSTIDPASITPEILVTNIAALDETKYSTSVTYTQDNCSILKASLWGKDISNVFHKVGDKDIHIDPFFKQNAIITDFLTDVENETAELIVQFLNNAPVNLLNTNFDSSNHYTILLSNKVGENQSIIAKKFVYTVGRSNLNALDSYTPYNDFESTLDSLTHVDLTVDISFNGTDNIFIIKESGTVLSKIISSSAITYNFNIIKIPSAFMQVDYTIGTTVTSLRKLATGNSIRIIDGVDYFFNPSYATINSLGEGYNDTFKLVTDSFRLLHVNTTSGTSYSNNTYSTTTKFNSDNIQIWLNCSADSATNYARGVKFGYLRGYQRAVGGTDTITIDRSATTGTFTLGTSGSNATKTFTIYKGQTVTLNGVSNDTTTYNLGLKLTFDKSSLSSTSLLVYNILVAVSDLTLAVTNSTNNRTIPISDYQNILSPYFANVKRSSIKSDYSGTFKIVYNIPDITIQNTPSSGYAGNPSTEANGNWNTFGNGSITHSDLVSSAGYTGISGIRINRDSSVKVFYAGYTSYFVVAPPVVNVYAVNEIPVKLERLNQISTLTPSYIASFHIKSANSYTISPSYVNSNSLTFEETNVKKYFDYLSYDSNVNRRKYFTIEGNYVTIKLYTNGVGPFYTDNLNTVVDPDSPIPIDNASTDIDTLINNKKMTQLSTIYTEGNSENGGVKVTYANNINTISYKQRILSSTNYNSTYNVLFSIANPFIRPYDSGFTPIYYNSTSYYLRLFTTIGSRVKFYQADIQFNGSGYTINIDRFDTGTIIDYNTILDVSSQNPDYNKLVSSNVKELIFPIYKYHTKQINITRSITDISGNIKDINTFRNETTFTDISNAAFTPVTNFISQYLGITISSITSQGLSKLQNIFNYNELTNFQSKSLYIYLPDMIQVKNVLGNTVYRVTNGGNVHAPRMTTSNLTMFTNSSATPSYSNIPGAGDIASIYNQNSLLDDDFTP